MSKNNNQKKYVLCISGSRDLDDYSLITKAISMHNLKLEDIKLIISGGAKGIDTKAKDFAEYNKIKFKEYPADWKNLKEKDAIIVNGPYGAYDKMAGFRRNKIMAEKADKLLAITNGSKGTEGMIKIMKELGKEVFVYEVDNPKDSSPSSAKGIEGKDYFIF